MAGSALKLERPPRSEGENNIMRTGSRRLAVVRHGPDRSGGVVNAPAGVRESVRAYVDSADAADDLTLRVL